MKASRYITERLVASRDVKDLHRVVRESYRAYQSITKVNISDTGFQNITISLSIRQEASHRVL